MPLEIAKSGPESIKYTAHTRYTGGKFFSLVGIMLERKAFDVAPHIYKETKTKVY